MTTGAPAQLSPQEFVDRNPMSRRQWLIVVLGLLMMIAEGLDAAVVAFVYPRIVDDWGTDLDTVTVTVTLSVLAMIAGGVLAGPLADRYGRKGVTVTGIAVFGLGTAGMALTHSIAPFAALRTAACLGLGAVLPTVMALVADWTPVRRRVQMVALAFTGVTAGTAVGGGLASALIPAHGWPTLLAVCGLAPLLLLPPVLLLVPESVGVLAARRPAELRRALAAVAPDQDLTHVVLEQTGPGRRRRPAIRVILSRDFAPTTLLLWLCFFVGQGVVFVILSYLPLLVEREGLTGSQAAVAVAVFGWGGLVGQLAVSFYALKHFDRFRVLAGLWALSVLGFAAAALWASQFVPLLAGAFALGLCLPSANAALQANAAVAYPPAVRATGMSWANSVGKLGPVAGGLLGGLMVGAGWTLPTVLLTLAVPVGLGILATLTLHARNREDGARAHPGPRPLPTPAAERT
ncbi:MFS transporter [Streptomyces fructofermentans]|uniref:MFS transporter n=1 Tax=Streptomyces fructofermentans TaxID=152141 RepID=A0A918U5H8_9ACTN|nr:MFS transporter [Streptomyces fructofermentans]GGX93652.1 MFS transporter [Streptomyces fructofermentans]